MASFANLVLADGTLPTGVNRTFVAMTNWNGVAKWRYIPSGAVALSAYLITNKFTPAPKPGGRWKDDLHVYIPQVDAPASAGGAYTPQPRIVSTCESRSLFWQSETAPDQQRQDLASLTVAAIVSTQIYDAIVKGLPPTG